MNDDREQAEYDARDAREEADADWAESQAARIRVLERKLEDAVREERDEREAGYRLEEAANRHTDLIREMLASAAVMETAGEYASVVKALRSGAQALEDAARDNAQLANERDAFRAAMYVAVARNEGQRDMTRDAERKVRTLTEERDALAVKVAQAREMLEPYPANERVVKALRILSDSDSSARLRAVQADAWDEGYKDGIDDDRDEPFQGDNPYRTEEADRGE